MPRYNLPRLLAAISSAALAADADPCNLGAVFLARIALPGSDAGEALRVVATDGKILAEHTLLPELDPGAGELGYLTLPPGDERDDSADAHPLGAPRPMIVPRWLRLGLEPKRKLPAGMSALVKLAAKAEAKGTRQPWRAELISRRGQAEGAPPVHGLRIETPAQVVHWEDAAPFPCFINYSRAFDCCQSDAPWKVQSNASGAIGLSPANLARLVAAMGLRPEAPVRITPGTRKGGTIVDPLIQQETKPRGVFMLITLPD